VRAQAWLNKAKSQGVGVFDESDVRRHVAGMQASDLAMEHHSFWNPFEGTAVKSDAPITGLRLKKGVFSDDYVSKQGDVIPRRAIDKYGSTLGVGGLRRNDFDILKQ
jgi:hypothetical protein